MSLKTEELLNKEEVLRLMNFSEPTLWRHVRAGTFVQPIRVGSAVLRWRGSEIEAFLQNHGDMKAAKRIKARK